MSLAILHFLPLLVLVILAGTGLLFGADLLHDLFKEIQSSPRKSSTKTALLFQNSREIDGSELSGEYFDAALKRMVEYAKDYRPDWILGVHPGGRLASVLVAKTIGLTREKCIYVRTDRGSSDGFGFEPLPNTLMEGRVLIIDDITRSGATLRAVKSFIEDSIYSGSTKFNTINIATMAVVVPAELDEWAIPVDWAAVWTKQYNFKMPWTTFSSKIKYAFALKQINESYNSQVMEKYEGLKRDFEYAYDLADKFVHSSRDRHISHNK